MITSHRHQPVWKRHSVRALRLVTLKDAIDSEASRRRRIREELPPGQTRIANAFLVSGPEFQYPERPVTVGVVAAAFGLSRSTVASHLRRIRRNHPNLFAEIWSVRQGQLESWRNQAAAARRERSRLWGKRRWAAEYRRLHGHWPWEEYAFA
jgi:hypothetical protein